MNYSFSIQRDIGFKTVVDVAYVGSAARHLLYQRNINPIPMYAKFDPKNIDTTTGSPLPNNFLRPYLGLSSINVRGFGGTSNYNALQLTANRRMSRGIQFGLSYTYSKALGIAAGDFDGMSPYFDMRSRNYGLLSYDTPHVLSINYAVDIPSPAKTNRFLNGVFGDWQLSGVTSFLSGTPFTPGMSLSDGADLTGSDAGARITILGDPHLSTGERTFDRNFKTEMFARTAPRDFGNAGIGVLRGPGVNNWDMSISKRIPLFSERRYFQFRSEFYNAFNHTQFSGFDTGARFDPTGKQINANFGAYNGARDPRRIQLSLRFMF
jgi:hypothetical protein